LPRLFVTLITPRNAAADTKLCVDLINLRMRQGDMLQIITSKYFRVVCQDFGKSVRGLKILLRQKIFFFESAKTEFDYLVRNLIFALFGLEVSETVLVWCNTVFGVRET
jgi:hypothetical protein